MSPADRRAILGGALPALLVLVAYLIFWVRPARTELARAEAGVLGARSAAPTPATVEGGRQRAQSLVEQLETARKETAACVTEGAPRPPSPDAGRALTTLLRKHGLVLGREAPAGAADAALLPPTWRAMPNASERLRTLELEGRFLDVLAALRGMQAPDSPLLPLRLSMRRSKTPGAMPSWTITLWV